MAASDTLRYREYPPPHDLRDLLECAWVAHDPRVRADRRIEHIIPDGCPEWIAHLGDPFTRWVGDRWRPQPRMFLAGALTRPWRLRGGRRLLTVGLRLRPGAGTTRFPLRMCDWADREVPMVALVGRRAARSGATAMRGVTDPEAAVRAALRWLRECPRRSPRGHGTVTRPAVAAILAGHGREPIAVLGDRLGLAPRRLERAFARDVGMGPKVFARIVRLHAALASLEPGVRQPAVDWALASGYFDQAHMARDARMVAGRRARAAREQDGALARHFTAPERLRRLLSGE
jgi:methylphosphotriester-DNA--protein-cysteine methyltransferase